MKKIKNKKSFKNLKRQMRDFLKNPTEYLKGKPMNNVLPFHQHQPQQAPAQAAEPITLNELQQFTQITHFLGNGISSLAIPEHVTAPRITALFEKIKAFYEAELKAQISLGY